MKTTNLTETHRELGAKMSEFAGYEMPIVYSNIKEEHNAVRERVGMFDVSHMGEFIIKGSDALKVLNKVGSNNPKKLKIGQAQYSCLPNEDGGIVDDFLLYRLDSDEYMLVVNASNIQKDWDWLQNYLKGDVTLTNISDQEGLLAVQGPKAIEVLQTLTDVDLTSIPYYHFKKGSIAGINNVIISATGYTGAGGFELYVDNKNLKALWDAIMKAGQEVNIQPAGLGCRDTLRLEMGYCLYGNDITDSTSPIEAGLSWITKLKNRKFNSSEIFAKQRQTGVNRKLVGFKIKDRRVPRKDYKIFNKEEKEIGVVTSGTLSPSLEIPIGMGYVETKYKTLGTKIFISTGRKMLEAEVVSLPFYISEV